MKAEMQGSGVLQAILASTRERVDGLRGQSAELRRRAEAAGAAPRFAGALRGPEVAVIAEVKRRSPSAGAIRANADAAGLARQYADAGAAAISVLTEPHHFGGSLGDLAAVAALGVSALRKDFILDVLQLMEARAAGASAVLLIVRILGRRGTEALLGSAREMGLETLVEVHDRGELEIAVGAGAEIIGVNARDLDTLGLRQETVIELLPLIPPGIVKVAESGIASRADVERVAAAGADAVLVGTALAAAPDPGVALRAMLGVRRSSVIGHRSS